MSLHFGLTGEQEQLRAAVRAFMEAHSPLSAVQRSVDTGAGHDKRVWELLCAELELVGLAVPESFGGSGASVFELCIALEELGRCLYTGPYFAAAALAAPALLALEDESTCADLLPRLVRGQITVGVAGLDRWPGSPTPPQALRSDGGWTVSGRVPRVLEGAHAEHIVVFADTPSGPEGFLVDGASVVRCLQDGLDPTRRLSECVFTDAPARLLGSPGRGQAVLDAVRDIVAVCVAAEAIGAAEAINALSLAHARRRTQFGQPIGAFQAVKHLCVDAAMAVQNAKQLTLYAAWAVSTGAVGASISASAAIAASTEASVLASNTGIQVHGGIGYTWEHPAHLFLKRAVTSRLLFGTPEQHRERHLSLLLAQS
ncbi:MAG: acyl-CoA dehydrogenase protein [Acidimicrobiaceae bacterium]|nr:acyl-CoA dehydrogenase protein [Acidimicrobiaceae bacterium]